MKRCDLCGEKAGALFGRPYRYDSGQTFIGMVCGKCTDRHRKLAENIIKGGSK